MEWDDILDIEHDFDQLESSNPLGVERTPQYHEARRRRVERLKHLIDTGRYEHPPPVLVAEGILLGRPKWGEALIDDNGDRVDEWWKL